MSHVKLIDQSLISSEFTVLLELSDTIKSKQASSASVLSEINNKLSNSNIECACILLDCLIKNSGPTFINELNNHNTIFTFIAEYIQNNTESTVKQHFVEWAHLLKPYNPFIFDLFIRLKYNNIEFNKYTANQVILECSLAPEWIDSDSCQLCGNNFNLINRKHHCRNCGKCVCNNCSKEKMILPKYGIMQEVRVCDDCKSNTSNSAIPTQSLDLSDKREQDELELAIKESLKLSSKSQKPQKPANDLEEQEERMIQQAIQLSLKEDSKLQQQHSNIKKNIYKEYTPQYDQPQRYETFNQQPQYEQQQYSQQTYSPVQPSPLPQDSFQLDLTQSEIASLDLFYAWMLHSSQQDPSLVSQQDVLRMHQRVKMIHHKLQLKLQQVNSELSDILKLQTNVGNGMQTMDGIVKKRLEKMKFNMPGQQGVGLPQGMSPPQYQPQQGQQPQYQQPQYTTAYTPQPHVQIPQPSAPQASAPELSPVEQKQEKKAQVSLIDL